MTVLSVALLSSCDQVPMTQDVPTPRLARTIASTGTTPEASAVVEKQSADDPLEGCDAPWFDQVAGSGRILIVDCETPAGGEVRFVHKDGENGRVKAFQMDAQASSAIVDSNAKLWDNKIVSVDFAAERGGMLLIANWTGKDFVLSNVNYYTGDEESLGLDYKDNSFFLTTERNGTERFTEVTQGQDKGRYLRETVSCEIKAKGHFDQVLDLSVNTAGRINAVGYLGITPQESGAFSCSIDADRSDGETTWTEENGETVVAFKGDGEDDELNRIFIRSEKGLYTVDFAVKVADFCGQSSVSATQIQLQSGEKICKSAELRD